ncbi:MAG: ATP-binding protein [Acidobacteriota bacterium]
MENVELVEIAVESALSQLDVDKDSSHWIGIAVREAVGNAIQHGNGMDPDKLVEIDFSVENDEIVVKVRDQGLGFDPDKVPNPLKVDNLLRPDGRGLLFMEKFMDSMEYSFDPARGTELTMKKKIENPQLATDSQQEEEI